MAAVQSSCSFICCVGMVCGRKQLGVENVENKVKPCWNQELKDAIQPKKVACKAWLQNKAESSLHSQYAEARMSAWKKSKMPSWENFGHELDSNSWQDNKVLFGKSFGVFAVKDLKLLELDPSRQKWCLINQ